MEEEFDSDLWCNVAGVTHKNADGSKRQDIISACSEGERLELVPEPDNPHSKDGTAVKVCRRNGEQIGYIPSLESARVAAMFQKGYKLWAVIRGVSGGTDSKPTLGVNITVRWLNTRTLKRMANDAAGIKPKAKRQPQATCPPNTTKRGRPRKEVAMVKGGRGTEKVWDSAITEGDDDNFEDEGQYSNAGSASEPMSKTALLLLGLGVGGVLVLFGANKQSAILIVIGALLAVAGVVLAVKIRGNW